MKKFTAYGPGSHPTLLLDDDVAEDAYKKLMKGEEVELDLDGKKVGFRASSAWAIEVEDFHDRRKQD